jgi:hypothetical protein
MTTAAGDPIFLDTNVVAYASVPESPFHADALLAIRTQVQAGSTLSAAGRFTMPTSSPPCRLTPSPACSRTAPTTSPATPG